MSTPTTLLAAVGVALVLTRNAFVVRPSGLLWPSIYRSSGVPLRQADGGHRPGLCRVEGRGRRCCCVTRAG
jgi:hypothetical protein